MSDADSPPPSREIDVAIYRESCRCVIVVDQDDANNQYVVRVYPKSDVEADEVLLSLYQMLKKRFEVRGGN